MSEMPDRISHRLLAQEDPECSSEARVDHKGGRWQWYALLTSHVHQMVHVVEAFLDVIDSHRPSNTSLAKTIAGS